MKTYFNYILILILLFNFACTKKGSADNVNEEIPTTAKASATGNFVSSVHNTTGKAYVTTNSEGEKILVFENFKTDNGPDLRVYISPNTTTKSYVEIGKLTAASGNFSYKLSKSVDYKTNDHVLIWCEDFSVLFGYAVLK